MWRSSSARRWFVRLSTAWSGANMTRAGDGRGGGGCRGGAEGRGDWSEVAWPSDILGEIWLPRSQKVQVAQASGVEVGE
ncbi:hypothetical protein B0T25DRAFT_546012 [Lasiosphaeria hispida]|uniref:Uncharacterized protein n=1 Tax=Lasiosphaeria hispida TaxID=260671 RepID=A0AAJ0HCY9_9PEZI|nr:hypothetical protein B0T25DRAFT_546012 [Lasiosphaeria hispida]